MTRKLNNKFRKINKTQNKKNKKLKKLQTRNRNAKNAKNNNNNKIKKMRSKKLKGGLSFGDVYKFSKGNVQSINDYRIWTYFTKRFFNIGIGMEDIYIDRFICRNQDFSIFMNQKFVKDMDVRDNVLFIYVTSVNYAFNDSYNIPFTEPILFELFDMAKFRLKKLYTISLPIIINLFTSTEINGLIKNQDEQIKNNKSILPETISNFINTFTNNPVMRLINQKRKIITDRIIISPRYRLFVYFFTELRKMLKTVNIDGVRIPEQTNETSNKTSNDNINIIDSDNDNNKEYMKQAKGLENIIKKNNNESFDDENKKIVITVDNADEIFDNVDEMIEIENNNDDNEKPLTGNEEAEVNKIITNNPDLQKMDNTVKENSNFLKSLVVYALGNKANDYIITTKTKILSKLNKYIDVGDLIYTNFENKSPFYTKKEAIIYFTRLLLKKDENIDLYNDDMLVEKLKSILNTTIDEAVLNNNEVYKFLNEYIAKTKFDKTKPVNFNDVLYSEEGRSISEVENVKRIDDTINNNDNVFDIVGNNMILSKQKEIINRLHTIIADKIDNQELKLDSLEYSFMISYKKMIENRRVKMSEELKNTYFASEVYKFREIILWIGIKSGHYNCSSPTNFLSVFIKQLIFFPIIGHFIGICYLALNCNVSAFIFYTINYIWIKYRDI